MSRRLVLLASILALALFAAACGGGTSDDVDTATGEIDQTIEIVALDPFAYEPGSIEVKRGTTVQIVLKNEGSIGHDLHIDEFNVATNVITPGQTASVTFTPNQVGEYKIYCAEPGHDAGGMNATLVVTN